MGRSTFRADLIEPTRHIGSLGRYGEDWPDSDLVELGVEDLAYVGRGSAPDPEATVCRQSPLWSLEEDAETVVDLPPAERVTLPIPDLAPAAPMPAAPRPVRGPSFPHRGYVPGQRRAPVRSSSRAGLRVIDAVVLFASLCTILVLLAVMAGVMAAGMLV